MIADGKKIQLASDAHFKKAESVIAHLQNKYVPQNMQINDNTTMKVLSQANISSNSKNPLQLLIKKI